MLIDTGADVTIVGEDWWPKGWALEASNLLVMGVGRVQAMKISAKPITVMLQDESQSTVRPYVMPLPICLLGCNVLSQLGECLLHSLTLQGQNIFGGSH